MNKCEECGEDYREECQECCTHDDVQYPVCLICGKDMHEHFVEHAEWIMDAAKDGSHE